MDTKKKRARVFWTKQKRKEVLVSIAKEMATIGRKSEKLPTFAQLEDWGVRIENLVVKSNASLEAEHYENLRGNPAGYM